MPTSSFDCTGGAGAAVAARPVGAPRASSPARVAVREVPAFEVTPSAEVLAETWRRELAHGVRSLGERHPILRRGHARRLLATLTVHVERGVRQPSRASGNPTSEQIAGMAEALLARPSVRLGPWAQQIWSHMARTGPIARTLARAFDVPADEAFGLGLLHDVGKLVLRDVFGSLGELWPDAVMQDALTSLHEPSGGLALLRWGVDPRSARAVAMHHRADPSLAGGRLSEVVYLAERIDLARSRNREVTLERWIEEGRLTASPDKIAAVVDKVMTSPRA